MHTIKYLLILVGVSYCRGVFSENVCGMTYISKTFSVIMALREDIIHFSVA